MNSFYDTKKYTSVLVGTNQFRRTLKNLKTPEKYETKHIKLQPNNLFISVRMKQQGKKEPIESMPQRPQVVFVETLGNFRGAYNNKGPITKHHSMGNLENVNSSDLLN